MHILSLLVVFGILALAFGVIGAMLIGNRARIMSALRGDVAQDGPSVAACPRTPTRRALAPRIAANDLRTRAALAA